MNTAKWLKILVLFLTVVISVLLCPPSAKVRAIPENAPQATRHRPKYDQFEHKTRAHRQDCINCHKFPTANWNKVRSGADAFADITEYPKHDSCLKCHAQQFFKGARPAICSICHTAASPRGGARHPFPNPREIFDKSPKGKKAETDFAITFPHDKHIEIVSRHSQTKDVFRYASLTFNRHLRSKAEESCAVCHQTLLPQGKSDDEYITKPPAKLGDAYWLKKGTFKSSPVGHATCFTCHSTDTGILPSPQTCSACHQLKSALPTADFDAKLAASMSVESRILLDAWKRRDSSGTFRHEFFAHDELSCSTCHNVLTMNTADAATKRVRLTSCATCHATPTSDDGGALNFEIDSRKADAAFQCAKCHVTFGKLPIPNSHLEAIKAASEKK